MLFRIQIVKRNTVVFYFTQPFTGLGMSNGNSSGCCMHFLYLPSEQAETFGTSSCCFLVLAKNIQYCKHVERRISPDGLLYCFQT